MKYLLLTWLLFTSCLVKKERGIPPSGFDERGRPTLRVTHFDREKVRQQSFDLSYETKNESIVQTLHLSPLLKAGLSILGGHMEMLTCERGGTFKVRDHLSYESISSPKEGKYDYILIDGYPMIFSSPHED